MMSNKGIRPFWLKTSILPMLMVLSLFWDTNILNGLDVLGVKTNLSISDIGFFICTLLYITFYSYELFNDYKSNRGISHLILLFLAVTLMGSVINNPHWLISLKTWIKVYLVFFLFMGIFRTTISVRNTLNVVCLIVIALNAIGIAEYFFIKEAAMQEFLLFFRIKESVQPGVFVSSLFTNSNPYGVFNALFLVTIASLRVAKHKAVSTYFLIMTLVCCSIGLFLSGSRNAFFALIIGLIFLACYQLVKRQAYEWIGIFCISIGMLFYFSIRYDLSIANKLGDVFPVIIKIHTGSEITCSDIRMNFNIKSLEEREEIWQTGIQKFRERPFLGWGISASRYWLGFSVPYSMHNFYLETLVTNGIVGLVLMLALIAIWLTRLRAGWCWAPVLALLFSFIFDTFFDLCGTWLVFVAWIVAMTTKDIFTPNMPDDNPVS